MNKWSENELDQIFTFEDKYLHTTCKIDLHLSKPKTTWRRLEDMSWRCLEDIMETSKILTGDICI